MMSDSKLKTLKSQVAELAEIVNAKLAARQELADEFAEVSNAPPARSDILRLVTAWVDESAARYVKGLAIQLEPFCRRADRVPDRVKLPIELLHLTLFKDGNGINQVTPGPEGLFYMLREPILLALEKAINEIPFSEFALDAETRDRRLKELGGKIDGLNKELDDLADFAAGAGVSIPRRELTPAEKESARHAAAAARRAAEEAARKPPEKITAAFPGDEAFQR